MTPAPDTVEADLEVSEAAMWMAATGYRHLPITDGDKLIGVASVKDVLWALTEQLAEDRPQSPSSLRLGAVRCDGR